VNKLATRLDLLFLALTITALNIQISLLHFVAAPILICVWPGIACARLLGLPLNWRDARLYTTVLIGSLALSPLIVFVTAPFVPFTPLGISLSIGLVTAAALLSVPPARTDELAISISRPAWVVITLTLCIVVVALLPVANAYRASLLPMQGAYIAGDWQKHYGLVWEILTTGIPPRNMYFTLDPPAIQPYYIFFHLTVALLAVLNDQMLSINFWLVACATMAAGAVLLGIYTLARLLWKSETAALASLLCVSLLGGLDVIPSLATYTLSTTPPTGPYIYVDGWDGCTSEISTFMAMYTWVPQHVLALAALLLAWLIYRLGRGGVRPAILVALCVASALGYSIYVPLGAAAGIGLYVLAKAIRLVRNRETDSVLRQALPWLVAGVIAALITLPLARYEMSGSAMGGEAPVTFWVRTAGVPSWGLLTAAIFQSSFPNGNVISQLLDLPLYFLFEVGVTLFLALIALAAFRFKLRQHPWRIGLLISVASLLISTFVRSTLGCNDLGFRSILPAQAMLALLAGGGWLALCDPAATGDEPADNAVARPRPASDRVRLKSRLLRGLLVSGLACLGMLVIYQFPWTYRFDISRTDSIVQPVSGLYPVETANGLAYRWSQKRIGLYTHALAQNESYRLAIRAGSGGRPPGAPAAFAEVWVNGFNIGHFVASETPQTYEFDVPELVLRGEDSVQLELGVTPYKPSDYGLGDQRDLGLLLDFIAMTPQAIDGPLVLPANNTLVAVAILFLMATLLGIRRWWLVGLLLALWTALWLARSEAAPLLPYAALLFGAAWMVRDFLPAASRSVRKQTSDGRPIFLYFLVALLAGFGLLTTVWQFVSFDVGKFLPPYDAAAAKQDTRSLALNDALNFLRTQTPRDTVLQIDPALMGTDMGLGLVAERRNFYYHDQVFNYQFPVSRVDGRRAQIEQSLGMPTMNEACDRFHRLKLDVIVLERSRPYPLLSDVGEPGSCLILLYENDLIEILRLVP
jgi:hypothetical protein